jgi:transcriptional regulator with XRE-family HTH domain
MRKGDRMKKSEIRNLLHQKIADGERVSNLKSARMARGVTQVDFAKKTGMVQPYIARLESGGQDINTISADKVYKMAKVLKCKMEDLIEPDRIEW